jgi:hypothetical protein
MRNSILNVWQVLIAENTNHHPAQYIAMPVHYEFQTNSSFNNRFQRGGC